MDRTASPTTMLIALCLAGLCMAGAAHADDRQAPGFSVRALDGRSIRLTDYRNRPVIVDFWATWCVPCRASLPHLSDMQVRYGKQGLAVIGMSVDENGTPPVRRFVDKMGLRFTIAMADDQILDDYGPIRSIPTTFFINRRGEIVRRVVGYIDGETMDAYAREILPGR